MVLGLVSSKEWELEDTDGLRRRVDHAAAYVPLEDLALSPQFGFAYMSAPPPAKAIAANLAWSYAGAVTRGGVPFLWLCGPMGVGKSVVGYEIFRQVYRSGVKASFMDFDQLGLCYPTPADDPYNHRVKAQNLAAVWPTYQAAGARCLIAVGGVTARETVLLYAGNVPGTVLTLCRLRASPERLTERVFRRGLGRGPVIPGPPPTTSKQQLAVMAAAAIREADELDTTDFADLCVDTDHYNVTQIAKHVRARAGGWPALTA